MIFLLWVVYNLGFEKIVLKSKSSNFQWLKKKKQLLQKQFAIQFIEYSPNAVFSPEFSKEIVLTSESR